MESHDQSNLLLCDKEDLVKYIMKLKAENEELESEVACLESDSCIDYAELKEENEEVWRAHEKMSDYHEIARAVSRVDINELKEENEELKMNTHRLNCSHCNLISSEDDIFLSLDCGEFTCEECFNEGKSKNIKEENEELKRVADHAEKVLEDSPVEEDDEGFAISDWFHEKMAKHIKFHMTDPGGEYNYIDPETKKHIFCLGSKGTLDDCRDFVENLEKEIEELKEKITCLESDSYNEVSLAEYEELNKENEELKKKIIGEHGCAERCKDKVLELLDIRMCLEDDVLKLKAENNEMRSKGRVLFYEDNLRLLQEIINKQKGEIENLKKEFNSLKGKK